MYTIEFINVHYLFFNPLDTSWTLSGQMNPFRVHKNIPPTGALDVKGDPWAIKIWVFLGSLHPKEPPELIWGQNSSYNWRYGPGSKVDFLSEGQKNRKI